MQTYLTRREIPLFRLSLLVLVSLAVNSSGSPQGYLSDEQTAPRSLDGLSSVLDDIGLRQPPRAPDRLIPGTLDRIRSTENWLQEASLTINPRNYYRYRDEGLPKNFWLRVRAGQNKQDGGVTRDEFQVILNYSLSF